jgi:hypothetical protein
MLCASAMHFGYNADFPFVKYKYITNEYPITMFVLPIRCGVAISSNHGPSSSAMLHGMRIRTYGYVKTVFSEHRLMGIRRVYVKECIKIQ